jgi:hypothetical protein
MAQEARFRPEDHQVLLKHKDRLLALTDELVKAFYDTLFATPNTRKVFHEGERPEREKTLRDWWQRTIEGPVDEDYWAWHGLGGPDPRQAGGHQPHDAGRSPGKPSRTWPWRPASARRTTRCC